MVSPIGNESSKMNVPIPGKVEGDKRIEKAVTPSLSQQPSERKNLKRKIDEWDEKHVAEKRSTSSTYTNVVKRVPPEVKAIIEQNRETLPDIEDNVRKIVESPVWDPKNPIFADKNHDYYALEALRKGEISQHQFATLMMFRTELLHQKNPQNINVLPLIDEDGDLHGDSLNIIAQTFYPPPRIEEALDEDKWTSNLLDNDSLLNEEQGNKFQKELKALPKSEQQYLLVEDDEPTSGKINDAVTRGWSVTQVLGFNQKFNALYRILWFDSNDQKFKLYRIIPSVGMMQAFLNAFAEEAPILDPVLGPCDSTDFDQDALDGTRKMGIPFTDAPQSSTADTFKALGNDFTLHDFYHAYIIACMPRSHRVQMRVAARLLDNLASQSEGVRDLREHILDMENGLYKEKHQTRLKQELKSKPEMLKNVLFWFALAHQCHLAHKRCKDFSSLNLQNTLTELVKHFGVEQAAKEDGITAEGLIALSTLPFASVCIDIIKSMQEIYQKELKK